ncbi:MAG: peptidoglycan editing factor PgeF [Synechococcus sp.]
MSSAGAPADPGNNDPLTVPDTAFNTLEGWTWIGCYGGYYLSCDLLESHRFEHGFFTRRWQGRQPDELATYLSAGITVHRPQQVHSSIVLEASTADRPPWPDGDGLVSDRGSQSLWVCGADCTPVLLADPESGHVAACHAGWRGVAKGILREAVQRLEQRGGKREQLLVALGPAISGASYQVEQTVAEQVLASLSPGGQRAAISIDSELRARIVQNDPSPGRCRLDIRAAATAQLQAAGLDATRISQCPLCTMEEPALFHSWRRDQVKAVQWSGIVSQADL